MVGAGLIAGRSLGIGRRGETAGLPAASIAVPLVGGRCADCWPGGGGPGYRRLTTPASYAAMAASTRLRTPSLLRMALTCAFTVPSTR